MDKITTDFLRAVKHLRDGVFYILAEIKLLAKDVKAIHERNNPKDDHPPSPEADPTNTAIPSTGKHHQSYETKQYALDKLRFGLEKKAFHVGKWTVVILAVYTGFTGYQTWLTRKIAVDTEDSVRGRLVIENFDFPRPIEVGEKISVKCHLKNIGHSQVIYGMVAETHRWKQMPDGNIPIVVDDVSIPLEPDMPVLETMIDIEGQQRLYRWNPVQQRPYPE